MLFVRVVNKSLPIFLIRSNKIIYINLKNHLKCLGEFLTSHMKMMAEKYQADDDQSLNISKFTKWTFVLCMLSGLAVLSEIDLIACHSKFVGK